MVFTELEERVLSLDLEVELQCRSGEIVIQGVPSGPHLSQGFLQIFLEVFSDGLHLIVVQHSAVWMLEVPEGDMLALTLVFAFGPQACFHEFEPPVPFIKLNTLVPVDDFRVVVRVLGSGVLDDLNSHLGCGSWSRHQRLVCFSVGVIY